LQDVVVVWGKEPVDKAIEMVVIDASIEMSDNQRGHADVHLKNDALLPFFGDVERFEKKMTIFAD